MITLKELISNAEELSEERLHEVIWHIRESPLLLGFLRVLQNTADMTIREFENISLATEADVREAAKKQGFIKGLRTFLEILANSDAEIIQKYKEEKEKVNERKS